MFATLILTLTPFLLNAVTGLIKTLPTFETLKYGTRRPILRLLAAGVSLVYVSLGLWLAPGSVSPDALTTVFTTVGLAFLAWLSSLGSYAAFFSKS